MNNMQANGFDLHTELPASPAFEQATPGMPPMVTPPAQPEQTPHWEDVETFLSALNGPGAPDDTGSPMFQGVTALDEVDGGRNSKGDSKGGAQREVRDVHGADDRMDGGMGDGEGGSFWSKLAAMPNLLHGKREQLESAMLKATRGADQAAMYEVSKRVSELYLEQGLTIKALSKTTQAIEQITKMQ
jgi:hypothetical protein